MTVQAPIEVRPGRRPLHPDVNEDMIEQLVRHFYAAVRRDDALGPIFEAVIPDDWEPHLETMMGFWSSVMLMSGRFKGQPVVKHRVLTDVTPEHFETWLALFRQSAEEICPPEIAAIFVDRAERIGASLKAAMFRP